MIKLNLNNWRGLGLLLLAAIGVARVHMVFGASDEKDAAASSYVPHDYVMVFEEIRHI